MYIYNVTINIDESVHDQWLKWMQEDHIPEMLATGRFKKALLLKVMVTEPMGGITYSVQYFAESEAVLKQYYEEDAAEMRKKAKAFEGKFVVFRTEMNVVSEHL